MTPSGRDWNEDSLSETPAIAHLQRLGYTYVPPEQLDAGRSSPREVILADRLSRALQKLNPWLSADNLHKAILAVTGLQAASLLEASEKLHTTLTYGIALEQDLGDGKKSHPVRFTTAIQPNGFKAQLVAESRETAALYQKTLEKLQAPPSACIISSSNKDEAPLVEHHTSEEERKKLIKRFCTPGDPLSILVVCDMLLTGFDAPVEQVMYLDSPLKEHTLLQAIARVNRVFDEKKTYGLIVDYWGVSEALTDALAICIRTTCSARCGG